MPAAHLHECGRRGQEAHARGQQEVCGREGGPAASAGVLRRRALRWFCLNSHEGQKLVVIDDGFTDTDNSTSLYVPSIGLVVAGDAVYNGIHPFMAETSEQSRLNWIAALERIEALKPRTVVAGHKKPDNSDSPQHIAATQQYIRDFNRLSHATTTTRELYDQMLSLYPDRVNPGSLWCSAKAAKAEEGERQ